MDDSASFSTDPARISPQVRAAACTMADAAFATRRKTLANSCKTYFAANPQVQEALPQIFAQAGIDPRRRGETLTVEEFIALGTAFLKWSVLLE